MAKSKLNLYFEENLVGRLIESDQHSIEFTYESSWLKSSKKFSISRSMPAREETRAYGKSPVLPGLEKVVTVQSRRLLSQLVK